MLTKPYYRIWRPYPDGPLAGVDKTGYLVDPRYASNRVDLIRGYHYLQQDLQQLFEFVEPADKNLPCYSHRLYALLLRASTEFETNAKSILTANRYSRENRLDIRDYHQLDRALRLSEYRVSIPMWAGGGKTIQPFTDWANGPTLDWYQDYNSVKHDRWQEFSRATLGNVLKAVAGVLAVVFSQFHVHALDSRGTVAMWLQDDNVYSRESCLFAIEPANSWSDSDHYNFVWTEITESPSPFRRFQF